MILFFDGICHLCNNFVWLVVRLDRQGKIQFAPLQGATAKDKLNKELIENPQSLVVIDGSKTYLESDAVIQVIKSLSTPWNWLAIVGFLPRPILNALYRMVAKNRYKVFGKYAECPLPPAKWRSRFLP